jgi:PKD repeat protein
MKKILFLFAGAVMFFTACTKMQTITATPQASFSTNIIPGSDVSENDIIQLTNTSSEDCTYFWDFGNGLTSTQKNPTVAYKIHGNYKIQLTSTNSKGISATSSATLTILCKFMNNKHTTSL